MIGNDNFPNMKFDEVNYIGEYLDRGGTLILKRTDKLEELRTREQLWEIEPSLMEENKKEFLGKPNYTNLVNKKNG